MSLHLYHVTLSAATAITHAACLRSPPPHGPGLLVVRNHTLSLLRVDRAGRLWTAATAEVFGVVRALETFRLEGALQDSIVVGTDSGKISVLDFDHVRGAFVRVHEETFGRSGVRRGVPGQFIAMDPAGRAVMIAALEAQKFVYVLSRDHEAKMTISSPLEAHRSGVFLLDLVGVPVGYNNPLFAAIELDVTAADADPTGCAQAAARPAIAWYELDLALNHVVRRALQLAPSTGATRLIAPPAPDDPMEGGATACVLVCGPGGITLRWAPPRGVDEDVLILGRGQDDAEAPSAVVAATTNDAPAAIIIQQMDGAYRRIAFAAGAPPTISSPLVGPARDLATAIVGLPQGLLFVATEAGPRDRLYYFRTPTELEGVDEILALHPLIDLLALPSPAVPKTFLALTGRGDSGRVRVLRHGVATEEAASVTMPAAATALWVVRGPGHGAGAAEDRHIVVAFAAHTLVLAVGETIEEVREGDAVFDALAADGRPTLGVARLADDALVQVLGDGVRYVGGADAAAAVWEPPRGARITFAAMSSRHVFVALTSEGGVNPDDPRGALLTIEGGAAHLTQVAVWSGRDEAAAAAHFVAATFDSEGSVLAIADAADCVRVFRIGRSPQSTTPAMAPPPQLSLHASPASISSVAVAPGGGGGHAILAVGHANGVVSTVELREGEAAAPRKLRVIGDRPVRVFYVEGSGAGHLIAASSTPWILPVEDPQTRTEDTVVRPRYTPWVPLLAPNFQVARGLHSPHCTHAIVSIADNQLVIFAVNRRHPDLALTPVAPDVPTNATPRHVALSPTPPFAFVACGDPESEAHAAILTFDTAQAAVVATTPLDPGVSTTAMAVCAFRDHPNEAFLVVGTATNQRWVPTRRCDAAHLLVFQIAPATQPPSLTLVHRKAVPDVVSSLANFSNRLLAGIGATLRLFDLGKRRAQLLCKCEIERKLPNAAVKIATIGDRVYLADLQESLHVVKHSRPENLALLAQDITPRWGTALAILDYNTAAIADKFGNVAVLRLPEKLINLENDPARSTRAFANGGLGGTNQLETFCNIYLADIVVRLAKLTLSPGGGEFLAYATISGCFGALIPIVSRDDVDLLTHLELFLRQEHPPLCGRNHLAYRSAYFPLKNVVDGDLIETYLHEAQEQGAVERSYEEIRRRIHGIRDQL